MIDSKTNSQRRKEEAFNELLAAYNKAVADIQAVLDKNPDIHFYREADGWDDSMDPLTSHVNRSMPADDILSWMYDNIVDGLCYVRPYSWTDDEIKELRSNRNLRKVGDWERIIQSHREQIAKYERLIEEAKHNAQG